MTPTSTTRRRRLLAVVGPGLLVAATGVGAGDLATSALAGAELGTAVLWAVVLGAALKFALTEGLARWQLATGETLLEGVLTRTPRPLRYAFLLYLLPWSWFVGSALVAACGVTAHALTGLFDEPERGQVVLGAVHSLAGLALVWWGGFRWFERLMSAAVLLMFVTVVATAVALGPQLGELARGLLVPRVPDAGGEGLRWTVAVLGGVGGTLTVLCYGYWIREEGREGTGALTTCRLDLAAGYAVTALFGLAMVVVGSRVEVAGSGAGLVVAIGERLEGELGPLARTAFLVGAWAAVFSSLLGVWQSVPQVFADFWRLADGRDDGPRVARDLVHTRAYRVYLVALALAPLAAAHVEFRQVQQLYALVGAAFMPLLALALLVLGRRRTLGAAANGPLGTAALLATLGFFAWAGWSRLAG